MLNWRVGGLFCVVLFAGAKAEATTCGHTYTFVSGTNAVASQVNQDFSDLVNCVTTLSGAGAITGANNVGIGTTSPIGKLHVAADTAGALVVSNAAGTGDVLKISGNNSIDSNYPSIRSDGSNLVLNPKTGGGLYLNNDVSGANSYLNPSGGNVGIGTTTPGSDVFMTGGLTINGANSSQLSVQQGGATGFVLNVASGAWTIFDKVGGTFNSNITGSGGKVQFPSIAITASAANAFLDAGNNNNILRSTSSIRYKRDIRPVSYDEARKVLELTPVSFRSKSATDDPNRVFGGLTAEDVAQQLPQFVNYISDDDGNTVPDGVQYDRIAAVALLSVVKEQQNEIETLRSCRLWCMVKEAVGLP